MNPFAMLSIAWIGVSVCVATGLYLTHNLNCLWAFFIPALIGISGGSNKEKEDK